MMFLSAKRAAPVLALALALAMTGSGFSAKSLFKKRENKAVEQPAAQEPAAPADAAAAQAVSETASEPEASVPAAEAAGAEMSYAQLQAENEKLKKEYAQLEADRDNVLSQTRNLLADRAELAMSREGADRLQDAVEIQKSHIKKLHAKFRKMLIESASVREHHENLKREHAELFQKYESTERTNEQLGLALTEKVENDPQYQKLLSEMNELKGNGQKWQEIAKKQESQLVEIQKKDLAVKKRETELTENIRIHLAAIKRLEAEKAEIIKQNRELVKAIKTAPNRVRDMAAENQLLIRETSEMHYNMGVFFADNRKFDRAAKEFERALDFNPNNAKVHYNLGFLYAEQLKNYDEALTHFRKYLEIDPGSQESERVRAYVLAKDAYDAKFDPAL